MKTLSTTIGSIELDLNNKKNWNIILLNKLHQFDQQVEVSKIPVFDQTWFCDSVWKN